MAQRYSIWMHYDEWQEDREDNGAWVKYDDHAAELATLRAENAAYRQSLMDVKGLINDYIWDNAGFVALHDAVNIVDEVLA